MKFFTLRHEIVSVYMVSHTFRLEAWPDTGSRSWLGVGGRIIGLTGPNRPTHPTHPTEVGSPRPE